MTLRFGVPRKSINNTQARDMASIIAAACVHECAQPTHLVKYIRERNVAVKSTTKIQYGVESIFGIARCMRCTLKRHIFLCNKKKTWLKDWIEKTMVFLTMCGAV